MEEIFTTLTAFDEINKDFQNVIDLVPRIVTSYIEFAKFYDIQRHKFHGVSEENISLSLKLENAQQNINKLEMKLQTVRRLFDDEVKKRKLVEEQLSVFEGQLDMVRDILQDNRNKLHDETKEKLVFLKDRTSIDLRDRLDTIAETDMETTGSVLSDLSYTRDEDELLNISDQETARGQKRHQTAATRPHVTKRRKSNKGKKIEMNTSKTLIATTTVRVDQNGPISATSTIETISQNENIMSTAKLPTTISSSILPSAPPASDDSEDEENIATNKDLLTPRVNNNGQIMQPFSMNRINTRPHIFIQKAMVKVENCNVCGKRIRFSTVGAKCRDCKSVCHVQCKDRVPLPCVPAPNTPNNKINGSGTIADYTPLTSPMVPSLVIHCVKEIESRGSTEIGLYRIPGSDKEVKSLKEKFLKGKGVPNLSQIADIHVICGTLKEFFRSLKEPLITFSRWGKFAEAVNNKDPDECKSALTIVIDNLPQPNRDTLAFIILHLQKVGEMPNCKMPISNLAKIFGPTLIGYSQFEPENVFAETALATKILTELLALPSEFWQTYIDDRENNRQQFDTEMQKTPSSHSIKSLFQSSSSVKPFSMKMIKFFETP